ncbi:hypothetical protein C6Q08_14330 [Burkholderia multivorans]|nr:hypothetical protein C6Q08_14330 [Burkholderia multivorans]
MLRGGGKRRGSRHVGTRMFTFRRAYTKNVHSSKNERANAISLTRKRFVRSCLRPDGRSRAPLEPATDGCRHDDFPAAGLPPNGLSLRASFPAYKETTP